VDYLVKPINPTELIARMRVHLSNARLTKSAQSALDSTGQHLFTSDTHGQVRWATPQTYALFAKANIGPGDDGVRFGQQLAHWLAASPKEGEVKVLDGLEYPLSIKLVGTHSNGDQLIKLIDGNRPTEAALLREKLDLTEREAEVLFWIANGKTNREAAEILSMSPRTVNKHLEMIFPKLGVENRTAAAGVALRYLSQAE
jgi:DNA-binding CsgD family transcriptional regulator